MRNHLVTKTLFRAKSRIPLIITIAMIGLMPLCLNANPLFVNYESERPISGSGLRITEHRRLQSFEEIETNINAIILIQTGSQQSVTVTLDDNLTNKISTTVANSTLTIRSLENYVSEQPCVIRITLPDLYEISSYGEESFDLDIPNCGHLVLRLDGSGKVLATGRVNELEIVVSGSVDVEIQKLVADKVRASLEGMGDIRLYAQKQFSGTISGWGSITYFGEPETATSAISGIGTIQPGSQGGNK